MSSPLSRRHFLQQLSLFTGAMLAAPFSASLSFGKTLGNASFNQIPQPLTDGNLYVPKNAMEGPLSTWSARPAGSCYMGGFKAPKLKVVRIAMIGCGFRAASNISRICHVPGAELVACCDIYEDRAKNLSERAAKITGKTCPIYSGDDVAYIQMLKEIKPDAVVISTSWEHHARLACQSMELGAHALVEVPMGVSIKELWKMVDTSERTKKHCMQLENVNYGRDELLFLNMVRMGLIGELLHGEAAYIHRLLGLLDSDSSKDTSWRPYHYVKRNGNPYPTHGLGPVAQYMNLCRGEDTFARLSSFSSPALGFNRYVSQQRDKRGWDRVKFEVGDMNTSIIKTHLGRTIMLQWDEATPRPYSRHNLIQGTAGTLAGFPTRVAGEQLGNGNYHEWIQDDAMAEIYERFEHPLWKRIGETATKLGGHGGMDYVMFHSVVECLQAGEPLDQNVYEGAAWCACTELSEKSVAQGGMPQLFPDFTRGEWRNTEPLAIRN